MGVTNMRAFQANQLNTNEHKKNARTIRSRSTHQFGEVAGAPHALGVPGGGRGAFDEFNAHGRENKTHGSVSASLPVATRPFRGQGSPPKQLLIIRLSYARSDGQPEQRTRLIFRCLTVILS